MAKDQFGKEVKVGDPVQMTGTIESLTDAAGVNVVVLLDQLMPPSGAQVRVHLNTVQITDTAPVEEPPPAKAPAHKADADEAHKKK